MHPAFIRISCIFILTIVLLSHNIVQAQPNEDVIYPNAELMPSFASGSGNLLIFINSNMKYPESALRDSIEGTVVVSFVVDKKGVIQEPKVTKSVAPSLDSEALRIIGIMPKWIDRFC